MKQTIFVCAALAIALHSAWVVADEKFPPPDPSIQFHCPNYDSIKVHRVDWATRSNVYVKTIPATCNDTTAVSPGYLR